MVSPESTCSTGGCALLNQPHWVVSIVAGSTWVLPGRPFAGTVRRVSCAGVEAGDMGGGAGCAGAGAGWATANEVPSRDAAAASAKAGTRRRAARTRAGGAGCNIVERLPSVPRTVATIGRALRRREPAHWR